MKKYMMMTAFCLMHMVSVLGASSSSSSSGSSSSNPTPTGYLMFEGGLRDELKEGKYTKHDVLFLGLVTNDINGQNFSVDCWQSTTSFKCYKDTAVEVPYDVLVPYAIKKNYDHFRPQQFNAWSWQQMLSLGFGLPIASWYVAQQLKLQQKYVYYAGTGVAAGLFAWAVYQIRCSAESSKINVTDDVKSTFKSAWCEIVPQLDDYKPNANNTKRESFFNDVLKDAKFISNEHGHTIIDIPSVDSTWNMYGNTIVQENLSSFDAWSDDDNKLKNALIKYGFEFHETLNKNNALLGLSAYAALLLCAYGSENNGSLVPSFISRVVSGK